MAVVNLVKKKQRKLKDVTESVVNDFSKDPFFVKKRERAKEVIGKYGIPENFTKNN